MISPAAFFLFKRSLIDQMWSSDSFSQPYLDLMEKVASRLHNSLVPVYEYPMNDMKDFTAVRKLLHPHKKWKKK
jgi:hypothetical protein